MQDSTPIAVGIDVGSIGTRLRAEAGSGRSAVADHVRTSSGWRPHEPVAAAVWPAALSDEALPRGLRPAAVAVGGHACETPRQCGESRSRLHALLGVPCLVLGDAELLLPATGLDKGVGLVAGTGSVAVGPPADGGRVQVGGWGAVLGDEGGSAGLVREAARAVWAAHDRGDPPDTLPVDDVVVAGSTVPAQPVLYEAFTAAPAEVLPSARPRPLRAPPVEEAVAPGRSLWCGDPGRSVSKTVFETVEFTTPGRIREFNSRSGVRVQLT